MNKLKKNHITIIIIALGLIFIVIGATRGEILTVLHKAIVVCLECIGIG